MNILGWVACVIMIIFFIVDITRENKPGIRLAACLIDVTITTYILLTLL
jgi:hypothetical protein